MLNVKQMSGNVRATLAGVGGSEFSPAAVGTVLRTGKKENQTVEERPS